MTRLTREWSNNLPTWTPDATRVAFTSARAGIRSLFWQRVDNQGGQDPVFPPGEFSGEVQGSSWLPDGRTVIFDALSPRTAWDLWVVALEGERAPKVLLQTSFNESQPALSPDGRVLAYVSNETGRSEVYLQSYPRAGESSRISVDGGTIPKWARDGRELFYWGGDGMMSVLIESASGRPAGLPRLLFRSPGGSYGIGLDGRFLMIQRPMSAPEAGPITVARNWFEELKAVAK